MADEIPQGSGPTVTHQTGGRPDAQSRYAAELCGGQNSRAVWEVIDRTREPLRRVICRTNRADAMMIVEALNGGTADTASGDRRDAAKALEAAEHQRPLASQPPIEWPR